MFIDPSLFNRKLAEQATEKASESNIYTVYHQY